MTFSDIPIMYFDHVLPHCPQLSPLPRLLVLFLFLYNTPSTFMSLYFRFHI
jgi:hypothetical protein